MRRNWYHSIVAIAFAALLAEVSWAQNTDGAEPPKMKMTTEIPEGLTTPDSIKTRLGELNFFDGVPDVESAQTGEHDGGSFRRADGFKGPFPDRQHHKRLYVLVAGDGR